VCLAAEVERVAQVGARRERDEDVTRAAVGAASRKAHGAMLEWHPAALRLVRDLAPLPRHMHRRVSRDTELDQEIADDAVEQLGGSRRKTVISLSGEPGGE
jgi:hypothetical protein